MPLFFLLAGVFHPTIQNLESIKKRAKTILVPYFLWSIILFAFWVFLGRFYGESASKDLSVYKNFIGIFYAQGDQTYMDWGIPMWFLPTIFLTFLLFYLVNKISQKRLQYLLISAIVIGGFFLKKTGFKFPWSLDVAMVSLFFYSIGYYFKNFIKSEEKPNWIVFIILGILHFSLFNFNDKVDMYRSIYGHELLFLINGFIGVAFYLSLFKLFPIFKSLQRLGRYTIPILAMQLRALTVIKLALMLLLGMQIFDFNEIEKFGISIVQVLLMLPILYIIEKYIPILNGDSKKV